MWIGYVALCVMAVCAAVRPWPRMWQLLWPVVAVPVSATAQPGRPALLEPGRAVGTLQARLGRVLAAGGFLVACAAGPLAAIGWCKQRQPGEAGAPCQCTGEAMAAQPCSTVLLPSVRCQRVDTSFCRVTPSEGSQGTQLLCRFDNPLCDVVAFVCARVLLLCVLVRACCVCCCGGGWWCHACLRLARLQSAKC